MILSMARHGNSPVDAVEDWDIDKLIDYSRALSRQLARERRGGKRRR